MGLIYGGFSSDGSLNHTRVRALKEELKRFPSDEFHEYSDACFEGGLYSIRLRKPPFPKEEVVVSEEGDFVIIADVRLDYRADLVKKLGLAQDSIHTYSDPQLVSLSFNKWRKKCVDHLEGDYVFLVYDRTKKEIWGARDPIGLRPLFFYQECGELYFSTSIRGLLSQTTNSSKINEQFWLNRILNTNCLAHETPHSGIYQIPIGTEISFSKNSFTAKRFFQWKGSPIAKSHEEREHELRKLITNAVESRMYPDYEIGSQLSGGLDSTAVTAIASNKLLQIDAQRKIWSASSVASEHEPHHRDERPWVELFSKNYTNIDNHFVSMKEETELNIEHSELFALMRFRRYAGYEIEDSFSKHFHQKNCKTVLSGWRGDHFISRHSFYSINELLVQGHWLFLAKNISKIRKWRGFSFFQFYKKLIKCNAPFGDRTKDVRMLLNQEWLTSVQPQINVLIEKENKWKKRDIEWDFNNILPANGNELLYYAEDISHIHSKPILTLHPLSDVRIIRYTLSLDGMDFEKDGMDRSLYRRAIKGIVPEEVRLRRTKGFYNYLEIKRVNNLLGKVLKDQKENLIHSPFAEYVNLREVFDTIELFLSKPTPTQKFDLKLAKAINVIGYLLYFASNRQYE